MMRNTKYKKKEKTCIDQHHTTWDLTSLSGYSISSTSPSPCSSPPRRGSMNITEVAAHFFFLDPSAGS